VQCPCFPFGLFNIQRSDPLCLYFMQQFFLFFFFIFCAAGVLPLVISTLFVIRSSRIFLSSFAFFVTIFQFVFSLISTRNHASSLTYFTFGPSNFSYVTFRFRIPRLVSYWYSFSYLRIRFACSVSQAVFVIFFRFVLFCSRVFIFMFFLLAFFFSYLFYASFCFFCSGCPYTKFLCSVHLLFFLTCFSFVLLPLPFGISGEQRFIYFSYFCAAVTVIAIGSFRSFTFIDHHGVLFVFFPPHHCIQNDDLPHFLQTPPLLLFSFISPRFRTLFFSRLDHYIFVLDAIPRSLIDFFSRIPLDLYTSPSLC